MSPLVGAPSCGIARCRGIIAVRSSICCACCRLTIAVRMARPRAAVTRCTTLLNALAWLTMDGGITASPPVMIGIMHRPSPAARKVSSHITY